ncbi:GreA/GreB family elongation factor, partial [Colwellia sp. BRX8-2]|nr:GreA/GreB family elongation factor [Colwellia sp. BRX8-2]
EGKVYFGAWVSLINEDDKELTYRVVGPDEWDVKKGEISLDSCDFTNDIIMSAQLFKTSLTRCSRVNGSSNVLPLISFKS